MRGVAWTGGGLRADPPTRSAAQSCGLRFEFVARSFFVKAFKKIAAAMIGGWVLPRPAVAASGRDIRLETHDGRAIERRPATLHVCLVRRE
jgi:hypothetical protein